MSSIGLESYGWSSEWDAACEAFVLKESGLRGMVTGPGRVVSQLGHTYRVVTADCVMECGVTPAFRRRTGLEGTGGFPAIGDWVMVGTLPDSQEVWIHGVLPRKGRFSRKGAGPKTEEQIVAANVDVAIIVTSAVFDFSPRRLERYIVAAWDSGASPVIVVNKMDLCQKPQELLEEAEGIAPGVPVVGISAVQVSGTDPLMKWLQAGRTGVLLGSSGVGKSSIVNSLLGYDKQGTGDLRAWDGKGRHTTVSRELFLLPGGGILIDTPGMRELQFWDSGDGLDIAFHDIAGLAESCFFKDCTHEKEPRCAVKDALVDGRLDLKRFRNYLSIKRQMSSVLHRQEQKSRLKDRGNKRGRA